MTVSPPSGICARVPAKTANAAQRSQPGSPAVRRAAIQLTRVTAIVITATTRFENSIAAWPPFSGNGRFPQRGQLSQPSPDAVSRTTAPVVTTR